MESYEKEQKKINENLQDVLSLMILLENDMELQKSDGIHVRIVRMMHQKVKNIQKLFTETRDAKETENK